MAKIVIMDNRNKKGVIDTYPPGSHGFAPPTLSYSSKETFTAVVKFPLKVGNKINLLRYGDNIPKVPVIVVKAILAVG
jgi:hypothetical protein